MEGIPSFTKKSIEDLKEKLPKGFTLLGVDLKYKTYVYVQTNYMSIHKEINFEGEVTDARINWSAIGAVTVESAEEFSQNMIESIKIAKLMDSLLKVEQISFDKIKKFVKSTNSVQETKK